LAENKYSKQDLIEYSSIYTYENDLLVEITYARAGKFLIERTEYKYDKTGKKTQALVYDSTDSLKNTIVYKYDSLNNLVSERIYNQINFLVTDLRYQYDERGNCILVDNLNTGVHNNKAYREVQRFDDRNNRIYKSFTLRDSLKWEYIARYNKKDSLIYEAVIDGKGNTVSYSTLKYDKHSRRIVMKQYQQDTTISIMETYYKYDKEGKLYMETVQRPKSKESFITRTYFYDDKGNWIYRIDKDERIELDLYIVHSQKLNYY
jgi:hypothetical protein